ncbi:MAG: hypothetical protein CM15mP120_01540 [Pseudomonadota bacterium]|nr:MAG: hypothetical protein CM15mP120_01540 [Pseudomonadota bacterium]
MHLHGAASNGKRLLFQPRSGGRQLFRLKIAAPKPMPLVPKAGNAQLIPAWVISALDSFTAEDAKPGALAAVSSITRFASAVVRQMPSHGLSTRVAVRVDCLDRAPAA